MCQINLFIPSLKLILMKTIYNFILCFLVFIFQTVLTYGTNYTWTGTTSSAWNTTTNWSPNGLPDSLDNVTVGTVTRSPYLDQNRKVNNLTLSADSINLNGFDILIKGTGTFNGGLILNGTVTIRGLLGHFAATRFAARINGRCGYYHMNGGTFELPVVLEDTSFAFYWNRWLYF
jgi:hypothetical protein